MNTQALDIGGLAGWATSIAASCRELPSVAIGVLSGSRDNLDRRVTDRLAATLCKEMQCNDMQRNDMQRSPAQTSRNILPAGAQRTLVIRLDVYTSNTLDRQLSQPPGIPAPRPSPLGHWSEVQIPMPVGKTASWSLTKLPNWLVEWRRQFELVLVELGPIDQAPSRTLGRLCNSCFVVLGPEVCGSPNWLKKHLAWHETSGTNIDGSLLTRREPARDEFVSQESHGRQAAA